MSGFASAFLSHLSNCDTAEFREIITIKQVATPKQLKMFRELTTLKEVCDDHLKQKFQTLVDVTNHLINGWIKI